jgi:hypothetical protein
MSGPPQAPAGLRTALWGIAVAVLGLGIALVATIQILQTERRAHERTQATLQSLRDSLRAAARSSDTGGAADGAQARIEGISRTDIKRLRQSGLANPVSDLKADLARHTELIPVSGTLGGNMGFYFPDQIWILNRRWACAYFEDGHTGGWMLLEYRVEGGRIRWRRLATMGL